jgi:hypothetical protein
MSDGMVYLKGKCYDDLPDELKEDLEVNWGEVEPNIWSFYCMRWNGINNISEKWEDYIRKLYNNPNIYSDTEWDILILNDEDEYGVIYQDIPRSMCKFSTRTEVIID